MTAQLGSDADGPDAQRPSKSLRKRELDSLRRFGQELVELPSGRLARLELPDELRAAIDEARRIPSFSARKRQLLTIGRMMEDIDAKAIAAMLVAMDHGALPRPPKAAPAPTAADVLADQLLDGDDAAIFALSDRFARDGLQDLRQAVRAARKQLQAGAARAAAAKTVAQCLSRLG